MLCPMEACDINGEINLDWTNYLRNNVTIYRFGTVDTFQLQNI